MVSGTWHYRSVARIGAVAAILALSGCASLNPVHWYHDVIGGPSSADAPPDSKSLDAGSEEPYPSLATVPSPATTVSSSADQAALADGLIADRAHARYAEQTATAADVAPLPSEISTAPEPTAPDFTNEADATAPPPPPRHVHRTRTKLVHPRAHTAPSAVDAALAASGLASGGAFGSSLGGASGSDQDSASSSVDSSQQVTPRESPAPQPVAPPPAKPSLAPLPTPVATVTKPATPSVPSTPAVALPSVPVLAPVAAPQAVSGAVAKVPASVAAVAIAFAPGTTALPSGALSALSPIVKAQHNDGGTIHAISHAVAGGDAATALGAYQDALARANAVKQALVSSGVPAVDVIAEVSPSAAATAGDRVEVVVGH